ncbi:hypothetical protein [Kitasatospora sp. GP82]|uniref:AAA family ATPase n=1 Tax=Kitasatospora sp. GP82 TaxID=3035089 RepID=UPI0032AEBD95
MRFTQRARHLRTPTGDSGDRGDLVAFVDEASGFAMRRGNVEPSAPRTIEVRNVSYTYHRTALNPGLLILDEPTSDLDPRAEHRIFHNLRVMAKGRAVLLVTHNIANTALADRVIVMEGGSILQRGTWASLQKEPGLFRELLELQRDRRMPGQRPATS